MKLVQGGMDAAYTVFQFEHGPAYQAAQLAFWHGVDAINPDVFMVMLLL